MAELTKIYLGQMVKLSVVYIDNSDDYDNRMTLYPRKFVDRIRTLFNPYSDLKCKVVELMFECRLKGRTVVNEYGGAQISYKEVMSASEPNSILGDVYFDANLINDADKLSKCNVRGYLDYCAGAGGASYYIICRQSDVEKAKKILFSKRY